MKRTILPILLLSLLLFLVSCSVKYTGFKQDSFSVSYPEWAASQDKGNDLVSVQKGACKVDIGIQDSKFDPSSLKIAVDISIIPALRRAGLSVDIDKLEGNEAILTLTGANAYGRQKYIACDNKLYKVSSACSKNDPVIDAVINSAKCSV